MASSTATCGAIALSTSERRAPELLFNCMLPSRLRLRAGARTTSAALAFRAASKDALIFALFVGPAGSCRVWVASELVWCERLV
eukprot:1520965-Prymnesium_polylepis.2